jgi:hypothetical protein
MKITGISEGFGPHILADDVFASRVSHGWETIRNAVAESTGKPPDRKIPPAVMIPQNLRIRKSQHRSGA